MAIQRAIAIAAHSDVIHGRPFATTATLKIPKKAKIIVKKEEKDNCYCNSLIELTLKKRIQRFIVKYSHFTNTVCIRDFDLSLVK